MAHTVVVRKLLFFAVLACCSLAATQTVTYTTAAVPAKVAIETIAKQTGVKLDCSPAMRTEIVILHLTNAPLAQVLAQIASVTSGTWTKEGDITYLVPSSAARQREEQQVQREYRDRIAAALKKIEDAQKEAAKPKPDQQDMRVFMAVTGGGALSGLARAIGIDGLASIGKGQRVVFSTAPTSMQRPLPAVAMSLIFEFVKEHNAIAAAVKADEPAKAAQEPDTQAFMAIFMPKKPKVITGTPAKALVVATRQGFVGLTLQVKLYDADGKVLAQQMVPLGIDVGFDPASFATPKKPTPPPTGVTVELSPYAKEIYEAGGAIGAMGGGSRLKLTPKLLETLHDPVNHDPLSFVYSEGLIAAAKDKKEQLVANLPDGVLSLFSNMSTAPKLTTDSFLKSIEAQAKVTDASGWMTVRPANPVEAREQRTDRVALRTLIAASVSNGYASLDDVAAYALRNPAPMTDAPASTMYVLLFAPNVLEQGMTGLVNWNLVRLYGTLSVTQKQGLRQGERIPFSRLDPTQRGLVQKMLFGEETDLDVDGAAPAGDPLTNTMMKQISRFSGGSEGDYRTEPTEIMANGLPANGVINITASVEPVAQAQTSSTDFARAAMLGPTELGLLDYMKDEMKSSQMASSIPTLDDLRIGTRTILNFTFVVADGVSQKGTLNDDQVPKDGPVYKMSALPADFVKAIADRKESLKKNPFWKMIATFGGMGQRGGPPP